MADLDLQPSETWTREKARKLHDVPLTELLFRAQAVHREHHPPNAVQLCKLLSIKTGACPEDCAYCPQSSKHNTELEAERLMSVQEVLNKAREAKASGATRFCMGAAWRGPKKDGEHFERVLKMVSGVRELGMEACATLGLIDEEQAFALKKAGLTAYNHNLDTSKSFYGNIIQTRDFEDRIKTIGNLPNLEVVNLVIWHVVVSARNFRGGLINGLSDRRQHQSVNEVKICSICLLSSKSLT